MRHAVKITRVIDTFRALLLFFFNVMVSRLTSFKWERVLKKASAPATRVQSATDAGLLEELPAFQAVAPSPQRRGETDSFALPYRREISREKRNCCASLRNFVIFTISKTFCCAPINNRWSPWSSFIIIFSLELKD